MARNRRHAFVAVGGVLLLGGAAAAACALDEEGIGPSGDGTFDGGGGRDASLDGAGDGAGDDAGICAPGRGECDGDGSVLCETDLTSDPASCGACGHGCLGASCVGGKCQPSALALAGTSYAIALADGGVYFTGLDAGAVYFVPGDGGTARALVTGVAIPRGLSLDDGFLYYTAAGANYVARIAIDAGAGVDAGEERLTTSMCARPYETARVGPDLVWVNNDSAPSAVARMPADATAGPTKIAGDAVDARGLAVGAADGYVYWVNATDRTVSRAPEAGGPLERLFTLPAATQAPFEIRVDRGEIWIACQTPAALVVDGGATGALYRLAVPSDPKDAGPVPPPIVATTPVRDVAVDSDWAYFTDFYGGRVARVPRDAGPDASPDILATGQSFPIVIRVDDGAIYWTNGGANGGLMRLAKPR